MFSLSHLAIPSQRKSRSISPENVTGEAGKGGMAEDGMGKPFAQELGQGWKISPSIVIPAQQRVVLADIDGPGVIRHMWMTLLHKNLRRFILRIFWEGQEIPSVEVPIGDFFASGLKKVGVIHSAPIAVNPKCAFNSYWEMPFTRHCRIELENRSSTDGIVYYQFDYTLEELSTPLWYFHAYHTRSNPLPYALVHTILPTLNTSGCYVGTYLTWQSNSTGWWGEGEVKFYIDEDNQFPTICGTGTEDYFFGSYNFEHPQKEEYLEFTSLYAGLPVIERPDGVYQSQSRFSMYRWHILDPIYFSTHIRVTIQALGWRHWDDGEPRRYLPLQDDICSTAFWYQKLPTMYIARFPDADVLDVH